MVYKAVTPVDPRRLSERLRRRDAEAANSGRTKHTEYTHSNVLRNATEREAAATSVRPTAEHTCSGGSAPKAAKNFRRLAIFNVIQNHRVLERA